jgi:hypothetical protein
VELEELYAGFLNQFFVTLMFNSGMPILTIIFFAYLTVSYAFDKLTFLRLYRLPPAFDATAALATTSLLHYAVILHILIALWMYSNPVEDDFSTIIIIVHVQSCMFWHNTKTKIIFFL